MISSSVSSPSSWGRLPAEPPKQLRPLYWSSDDPMTDLPSSISALPYGCGRSYGDVCLNSNGVLIPTSGARRILSFDPQQGILKCEAGITLRHILQFSIPKGWFLPVTPGTMEVTLGGAIANDVHGKNHHLAGTFGRYVKSIEILRSDIGRVPCSPEENSELFHATIGGLGLTGLMTVATIQLKRASPWIDAEMIKFEGLDEFDSLSDQSDCVYEYTVAWIDCVDAFYRWGRGIFFRGQHKPMTRSGNEFVWENPKLRASIPFELPSGLLNRWTVKGFNLAYYYKQLPKKKREIQYFRPFFYPLDGVKHWNLIYGPQGLFQFQFVIPTREKAALHEIFSTLARSGQASFLAVLKKFGHLNSPGVLSFPKEGYTLTLDFPNRGRLTLELLDRLTAIVTAAGGRLYPAKDAHMHRSVFYQGFAADLEKFYPCLDPKMSSNFWRRVGKD